MQIRPLETGSKKDIQGLIALMKQWDDLSIVSFDKIEERAKKIQAANNSVIFLCCDQDRYYGYIQLVECVYLGIKPFVEIQAILVDKNFRQQGIGKKLLERGEQWAKSRGIATIVLSSRVQLKEAHAFYEKLGYENYKQAYFFKKKL